MWSVDLLVLAEIVVRTGLLLCPARGAVRAIGTLGGAVVGRITGLIFGQTCKNNVSPMMKQLTLRN